MNKKILVTAVNEKLAVSGFKDYCPNGLQVDGKEEVSHVVVAVSASEKLFLAAADEGADLVIVHHGIFWNSVSPVIKGSHKKRIKVLLDNDISLAAYHLPLDKHQELGNNAQLAKILELTNVLPFGDYKGVPIGYQGDLKSSSDAKEFMHTLKKSCGNEVRFFGNPDQTINRVGIVSGGASDLVYEAASSGVDAFVTGEASEFVVRFAEEEGIAFYAAGHYATERFGVKALGEWIGSTFGIKVSFIDLPVPV